MGYISITKASPAALQQLCESSKAVKLLRSKFQTGELNGIELPKTMRELEELFKEHPLNNFRTCFNKIKKQLQSEGIYALPPLLPRISQFSNHF